MERKSKIVKIGGVKIGGGLPPVVQGMVKTDPLNIEATVAQIKEIQQAGAKLVRLAIPNVKAAKKISPIREMVDVPLAADIHFNYRLALEVIDRGIDKVRINPGNLSPREILLVAERAGKNKIPLRVGVNSGSLPREILEKISRSRETQEKKRRLMAEAMVDLALSCVKLLEDSGFEDIVVSLKSSDVPVTILSNRIIAEKVPYPIHLGITATGPAPQGVIKSAVGLGALLSEGIGDTIRVSLTCSPVEEVRLAYEILKYLELIPHGPTLVACPTCGRCRGNVLSIARRVLEEMDRITSPIKIAVMGCEVNGPGEAVEADIGIACTKGGGILFKKGRLLNKMKERELVDTLIREIHSMDQDLRSM